VPTDALIEITVKPEKVSKIDGALSSMPPTTVFPEVVRTHRPITPIVYEQISMSIIDQSIGDSSVDETRPYKRPKHL
jgi:hypothetical protein